MTNERKKGAVLSYFSIIINTVITLLYTPFLLRMIDQSEYGLYSIVASIIGYLTILDMGFGNALIVFTSKYRQQKRYEDEKKLHGMFLRIFMILGVIAGLLSLFLTFNVNHFFADTMTSAELLKIKIMMLILTVNLFLTFPFSIYNSIISAYEKFTFQKILAIIRSILNPIIMIPVLLLGGKAISMTIVLTILNLFCYLSNWLFCRNKLEIKIRFHKFDFTLFKEIFGYSFFIFLGVIVDKINWSVDQFILGSVCGAVAVSIYAVASNFNNLFINLSSSLSGVLLPKISKMVAQETPMKILSLEFSKIGRIQWFVIFFMISGFILFGREFILLWAGDGYQNAYVISLILLIPLSIPLIQNLGISILQALNKHKFRAILLLFIAVGNILLSIPLAIKYGGIGSAIGTSVSLIIGNIIILNLYYHFKIGLNMKMFWKEIISMTIPLLIPFIIIFLLTLFIPINGFLGILVYGTLFAFFYFIIAYFFVMNLYEKNILISVRRKVIK